MVQTTRGRLLVAVVQAICSASGEGFSCCRIAIYHDKLGEGCHVRVCALLDVMDDPDSARVWAPTQPSPGAVSLSAEIALVSVTMKRLNLVN